MAHDEQRWLTPRLLKAATLCNQTPAKSESPLWLGIDLGTCDVVSMVVDSDGQPVAVCWTGPMSCAMASSGISLVR